jgi:hypothetical protein
LFQFLASDQREQQLASYYLHAKANDKFLAPAQILKNEKLIGCLQARLSFAVACSFEQPKK